MQAQLKRAFITIHLNNYRTLPIDAINRKTLEIEPSINNERLAFFAEI